MGNRVVFGKPDIQKGDIQAVTGVLGSGWIGMGAVTEALERSFVRFTGARYAVAVSSGSGGLFLSMLASGIGKGDEVITSPMTFPATANEIIHTGARVRFVDVDSTGNIDAAKIERAVTRKTKAILPIHLHGRPCDMSAVMSLARKHGLMVIEDAAHAFGATYRGIINHVTEIAHRIILGKLIGINTVRVEHMQNAPGGKMHDPRVVRDHHFIVPVDKTVTQGNTVYRNNNQNKQDNKPYLFFLGAIVHKMFSTISCLTRKMQ